jgi:hypothetical protein
MRLRALQSNAEHLDADRISHELLTRGTLTVTDLKAVQTEFLGGVSGKKETEPITAIESELFSYRKSRLRGNEIRGF